MQITASAPAKVRLAPSNENQGSRVYRLRKRFAVVQFDAEARGRIVFLPEGAELRLIGASCLSGLLEVLCQDDCYHIFQVDLLGPWSVPIKSQARELRPSEPDEPRSRSGLALSRWQLRRIHSPAKKM